MFGATVIAYTTFRKIRYLNYITKLLMQQSYAKRSIRDHCQNRSQVFFP